MPHKKRPGLVYWHANCAQHHVASIQSRSDPQGTSQESSGDTPSKSGAPKERPLESGAPGTLNRSLPVC